MKRQRKKFKKGIHMKKIDIERSKCLSTVPSLTWLIAERFEALLAKKRTKNHGKKNANSLTSQNKNTDR